MRVSTIIIIIALIVGAYFAAKHFGYIGAGEKAVTESFTAHYQKGQGLYSQSKYEDSIKSLEHALELDPDHDDAPTCMARIGDCYKEIGMRDRNNEMYKKAVEYYKKTCDTYPNSDIVGRVKQSEEKTRALGGW